MRTPIEAGHAGVPRPTAADARRRLCTPTRRQLLGAAAAAVTLAGVSACSTEAPNTSGRDPLPDPRHRMLLGAYTQLSGTSGTEAATEQRERGLGRRYNLEVTYYDWRDPFPDFGEAGIVAHHRIPVMTWYGPGKDPGAQHTLAEVLNGSQDAWIAQQAKAIRRFGHTIWLRPMIEMNGTWYRGYSGRPGDYQRAWHRIRSIFEAARVRNVWWVWCPNITPMDWDRYYPGDHEVDIIAVDGYSTRADGNWPSFGRLFQPFFQHYAGRKPLMVAETATDAGGRRAGDYITGMRTYLRQLAGPQYGAVAVCWFDTDTDAAHEWSLRQSPQAWSAWRALARDPYFGGP